jgi:hypothetical protein
MHVLLTETVTPRAKEAARSLADAGHVVHRCHSDDDLDTNCWATRGRECPLEREPIDLVVTVRPTGAPRPTPLEDGVVCGVRRHVPVLVAGAVEGHTNDPWTRWESLAWPGTDLSDVAARVANAALPDHSAAATNALRFSLLKSDIHEPASASVYRHLGSLRVVIESDGELPRVAVQRAAVRICQALRHVDPYAKGIDVVCPKREQR